MDAPQTPPLPLRWIAPFAALLLLAYAGCKPAADDSPAQSSVAPQTPPPAQSAVQLAARPPAQPAGEKSETETFFSEWLTLHGEKDVVVDARGVGLAGNETRLRASTYGVNKRPAGGVSVEMEFRITLPDKREIVEFVAGIGDDETKARKDSMANFILTTFHVIYKSFMNAADPHQEIETVAIDGADRAMARGNLYVRANQKLGDEQMKSINEHIKELLLHQHFDGRPHWLKIVYGQNQSRPLTLAVTLDNRDDNPALNAAVKQIPWPVRDDFYMAKQFIVIK